VSKDRQPTPPSSAGGNNSANCTTQPCPNCEYWNQDHSTDYNGPDSKYVTSSQFAGQAVAFRLGANLAAGNITITSIFKWGTVAADVTEAQKTDTINQFKAKVAGWGNRFNMKITDPVCGVKTLPVRFRLLWSPGDTTDAAPFQVNLYKTYPRAGVTGWNIDMGYDSQVTPNSAWVLAHEYGHTLCLKDEYFYSGVTSATVVYKKPNGTTESVALEPSSGNIMFRHGDTTYLKRFFHFTAIEAQELLRAQSGRNVTCEIV
jgi:type VI secretion system secreted protein VgrG